MEITEAKRLLIERFTDEIADCPLKTVRRQSSVRSAHDAEAEDIIRIMELLDNQDDLKKVRFAATNLDRLPKYGPEEINVCSVMDKQVCSENKVDALSKHMNDIQGSDISVIAATRHDEQFVMMTTKIQEQLDLFTAACAKVTDSLRSSNSGSTAAVNDTAASVDRSCNVIITGVEESRKMSVWRDTVARILVITAGRDVRIEDAFRLGRFNNQRSRPILVKLASVWDRRLILSGSHKLNSDVQFSRRVYVSADKPLQVRRKDTMDQHSCLSSLYMPHRTIDVFPFHTKDIASSHPSL